MGKYTGILLVSDWDRTVTGPDRKIPPVNTEAVLRFMEEGGRLSIATGHTRVSHGSRWNQLPTNAPHIVFNGAMIYDYAAGETVWQGPLPETMRPLFAQLLSEFPNLHFEIQTPDAIYVFGKDLGLAEVFASMGVSIREAPLNEIPQPWIQFAVSDNPEPPKDVKGPIDWFRYIDPKIAETFAGIAARIDAPEVGCTASRSLPFLIEAQAAGCSKGETARKLLDILGCETLVCCGDALNDLSLLRMADKAFVAGDGAKELLDMGFEKTCSSSEGVLADVISRL